MRKSLSARRRAVALLPLVVMSLGAWTHAPVRPPNPVHLRAVFLGDAYTAGYGIAPVDGNALLCVRATDNVPAVMVDQLADQAVEVQVQADVSCAGARLNHVWEPQDLGGGLTAEPQKRALRKDTQLVVGSLGADTVGLGPILKQCSTRLRGNEGALMPATAVDTASPAADCRAFFEKGAGAAWLKERFAVAATDLDKLFSEIRSESPDARAVLVGYPRLVPEDTATCRAAVPGGTEKPLADVPENALSFLDKKVQVPLNDLMKAKAAANGAHFVDLYAHTEPLTACAGLERGIGALLEPSTVTLLHQPLPWFLHPNETGRDTYGDVAAKDIAKLYVK